MVQEYMMTGMFDKQKQKLIFACFAAAGALRGLVPKTCFISYFSFNCNFSFSFFLLLFLEVFQHKRDLAATLADFTDRVLNCIEDPFESLAKNSAVSIYLS